MELKEFFNIGTDKFGILQLEDTPAAGRYRFLGLDALKKLGEYDNVVKPENYKLVFTSDFSRFPDIEARLGSKSAMWLLEAIYQRFNVDLPLDFKARSASVSDIILLRRNGTNSAWYVDSYGYTEMLDFLKKLEESVNK